MIKTVFTTLIVSLISGSLAHAFAPAQPKKATLIQAKATEIVIQEERPYSCVLEGAEAGFLTQKVDVPRITAKNLQNAAELAITPFITVTPVKGDMGVQIIVEGKSMFIRNINCKPVDQSI